LQIFGSVLYDSKSSLRWGGGVGWIVYNEGLLANLYYPSNFTSVVTEGEAMTFNDPTDDIVNGYRELTLRMSIRAGLEEREDLEDDSNNLTQSVPYISRQARVQYAADRGALALAVVVSLVGPLAVLVLFWGWWDLGRKFSMSPLEVANAFLLVPHGSRSGGMGPDFHTDQAHTGDSETAAAELLAGCSSNASAEQLLTQIYSNTGSKKVHGRGPVLQYGISTNTGRLSFLLARPGIPVRKPRRGDTL